MSTGTATETVEYHNRNRNSTDEYRCRKEAEAITCFKLPKLEIAQQVTKRVHKMLRHTKGYEQVTHKCHLLALGARTQNMHGLDPRLQLPFSGPFVQSLVSNFNMTNTNCRVSAAVLLADLAKYCGCIFQR